MKAVIAMCFVVVFISVSAILTGVSIVIMVAPLSVSIPLSLAIIFAIAVVIHHSYAMKPGDGGGQ